MLKDFDEFVDFCFKHGETLKNHREFGDRARDLREAIKKDEEFIEFLWKLLWDDLSDGDTPTEEDFERLKAELTKREIIDGDFTY